ncbi:MAG: S1C family serine protease, partial [Sphingomonas sp.]
MRRFLLLLLALCWAAPAAADDIGATARGVVRLVTIAVVDGQVVGFGHGSGVAIAPGRIVTNAHVVELAERYPDNVVVGVVPSEGDKSYQGRVVAYDAERDLALIQFTGATLPPAALYTGPASEGDPVVALGYPGNVDLATAKSAADYIRPTSPVRSEGVFSGRRSLSGVEVLLHTANIARGNSGGPLLDRCGRVIGINSAITRGEDGDSPFGFAIADTELAAFLRAAKQPFAAVGTPCTSIEERLREDGEAEARA